MTGSSVSRRRARRLGTAIVLGAAGFGLLAAPPTAAAAGARSPSARVCDGLVVAVEGPSSDEVAAPFLAARALVEGRLGVGAPAGSTEVLALKSPGPLARLPHPYARPGTSGALTPGPLGAVVVLKVKDKERPLGTRAAEAAAEWTRLALDAGAGPLPPWLEGGLASVAATARMEDGRATLPAPPFGRLVAAGSRLVGLRTLAEGPYEPARDPARWFTAWVLADWLVRDDERGRPLVVEWLRAGAARPALEDQAARALPDLDIRLAVHARGGAPALDLGPGPSCRPAVEGADAAPHLATALGGAHLLRARPGRLPKDVSSRLGTVHEAERSAGWHLRRAWADLVLGRTADAEATLLRLGTSRLAGLDWLLALAAAGGMGPTALAAAPDRAAAAGAAMDEVNGGQAPTTPAAARERLALAAVAGGEGSGEAARSAIAAGPARYGRAWPAGLLPGLVERDPAWFVAKAAEGAR